MPHPALAGLSPTLNIAHRGGSALAPENTLAAFVPAVERHRCQVLELDLQRTADGILVVAHDPTLDRCTDGEGPISELTFAALSRVDAGYRFTPDGRTFPFRALGVRIPSFEAVLTCPALAGVHLNVDVKTDLAGVELAVAGLVRKHHAVERTWCGSGSDAVAHRLLQALPEGCHFSPAEALARFILSVRAGATPSEFPWQVLDLPLWYDGARLVSPALLEAARTAGKWVNVWTVDDPGELRTLVAEGVGGIMTDRPDLLGAILAAAGA